MQEPPHSLIAGFERQLKAIHSDFRCVWGEQEYGVERWVIQRRLPADVHAQCLEEFQAANPGGERFVEQSLTDDNGEIRKSRRWDVVNPWVLASIIEDPRFNDLDDPRGYRIPDNRDIAAMWHWIHDYRNIEEQLRAIRSERATKEQEQKEERIGHIARELKNNTGHLFGDAFVDKPQTVLEGTEI